MEKIIRDGKVAVLYSPGYGAGWYSWNTNVKECIFHPTIVILVESNQTEKITVELCRELFGENFYSGGAKDLTIKWLPEGTHYTIEEYDGSESLRLLEDLQIIA
jgi:hypothetical protein